MRRKAKVDRTQPEIVAALRRVGAVVEIMSGAHGGFPDLMVGYRGEIHLLEVKDGMAPLSQQKLKPLQVEFFERWKGYPVHVVGSVDEAFGAVGVMDKEE